MEPDDANKAGLNGTEKAANKGRGVDIGDEVLKRRRLRNYVVGLAVLLFMALIYVVTIVRLGGGAGRAPG